MIIATGCNSHNTPESCDELSMQKFRGVPLATKRFEENCQNIEVKYTAELCQSALAELIRTNNLSEVKLKFGVPVESCFTGADLKRFGKE